MVGEQIKLKIEKMTVGGAGIGRHNGLVVFVDYSAPGDLLLVEIIEQKKNFSFGKIIEILEPGISRVDSPCRHFGQCGGCSWQHLKKEEQLKQKSLIVEDSLKELLKKQSFEIRNILPSPKEYSYRNRVQAIAKDSAWHFRKKHSHDLVKISDCLLVEEPLKSTFITPPKNLKNELRYDIRLVDNLEVLITPLDQNIELVGFSQVNRFQNVELITHVLNAFSDRNEGDLYEFYAGAGNFTFPLLDKKSFSHVWAVEGSPALAKMAHKILLEKNISSKRLSFHLGDVGDFLKTKWPNSNDSVFLDPPRIGAEENVIKTLALSRPRQIVYLSCHPVTLCRDLLRLLQFESSFQIDWVQPFEMFPQTDHVEVLVSLTLN